MDDTQLLEKMERYLSGNMLPEEEASFNKLRKSNPEIDQQVVEHAFFLHQLNEFESVRQLKNSLNDTHQQLAARGDIKSPGQQGQSKIVYLFNRYKRTAGIAASIAGITALCISALVWSVSPSKPANKKDIEILNRSIRLIDNKVNQVKNQNDKLRQQITTVAETAKPIREYTSGGTGFLVDAKGYLFTNYHVIEQARYVAVQNSEGKDFGAKVVYRDPERDIAILKIDDSEFKAPPPIPYAIRKTTGDIAEPVYSLGYPRNDIVYGEGYLAAKSGYDGDTLSVQISINANRGNSGSPILNQNGEIIGVLNARQTSAEGVVFAIKAKYIYNALTQLKKTDTAFQHVKLPTTSSLKGADRTQQVKKIVDYVYMVKVQ